MSMMALQNSKDWVYFLSNFKVLQILRVEITENQTQIYHKQSWSPPQILFVRTTTTTSAFYGPLYGTIWVRWYKRNIHQLTPILIISHPLSAIFIYCTAIHSSSLSTLCTRQSVCTTSVQVFFDQPVGWHPALHMPYISSPIGVFFSLHMPMPVRAVLL